MYCYIQLWYYILSIPHILALSKVFLFSYVLWRVYLVRLIPCYCSYIVLIHHCPKLVESFSSQTYYIFQHTIFVMCISFSQEFVIQWLLLVHVCQICFSLIILLQINTVGFLVWTDSLFSCQTLLNLTVRHGFAHCWKPYSDIYCLQPRHLNPSP